jgi:hypothetical protein
MMPYRVIFQKILKDDPASMYLESHGANSFEDAYKRAVPGGNDLAHWHILMRHAAQAAIATGDPVLVSYNEPNSQDMSLVRMWIQKPLDTSAPLDLRTLPMP